MISRKIIQKQIEYGVLKTVVRGISMLPGYKDGDIVYVKKIDRDLSVGDLVWFYSDDRYIMHRIIAFEGEYIITKGDNNRYADRPVHVREILGIVEDKNKKRYLENHSRTSNIVINVWKKESYNIYKKYCKTFGFEVISVPQKVFEDGYNVCVSRVATKTVRDILSNMSDKKVYFHVGVDITHIAGYEERGFVSDSLFDCVVRIGPYSMEEVASIEENILTILSGIGIAEIL